MKCLFLGVCVPTVDVGEPNIRLVLGLSISIMVVAIGISIQTQIMPCASGSRQ